MTIKKGCPCLGVVLSGGLSSRMGTDKALLKRDHETMLSYSIEQIKKAGVSDVAVSGKQHGEPDLIDNLGPMGGIYTMIEKYQPNALLILPVDLPFMDSQNLQQLKSIGELSGQPCFYQGNYLPLYLPVTAFVEQFMKKTFLPFTQKTKAQKGPSIQTLLAQTPHKIIGVNNERSLFNSNTPEQWSQAKLQIKHAALHRNKKYGMSHV